MSRYTIDGIEYPGVTSILGLLDKPFLKQWAANCAVDYIENNINNIFIFCNDGGGYFDNYIENYYFKEARTAYKTISNEAKDTGSQVHALIEDYIKGRIYKTDPGFDLSEVDYKTESAIISFLSWEQKNDIEYLESEKPVCCHEHGFAGTADILCKMNGKTYLIDIKTSKGFYDGYAKQLTAYKYAREEVKTENKIDVIFRGDAEFHKDIEYRPVKIDGIGILRLDKETGLPEFKDYTEQYERKLESFLHLVRFYYADKKRRLKNNPFVK